MPTPLGDRIRRLRREAKMTLESLAMRIDSSKSYVWEIENKDVARPSAEKLVLIATALQTTVDYLLQGSDVTNAEEARDKAFYRKYMAQDPAKRRQMQKILDSLDDD
ncbi:MAG: helix-turn-helix domain-containing protein [Sphingomonadales bacterium]